jgi:hypothetical protein
MKEDGVNPHEANAVAGESDLESMFELWVATH